MDVSAATVGFFSKDKKNANVEGRSVRYKYTTKSRFEEMQQ